jgi:hypothetical protein
MTIKQFNGEWVCKEDRVLFRFNTHDDQEFSFWLTRFVLRGLIQGADDLVVKALEREHAPEVAQVMNTFQQAAVTQRLNFGETFQAAQQQPLGPAPLLVTGLLLNHDGDAVSLRLDVDTGQSVTVQMNASVLQVMLALLDKLQATAQWDVGLPNADEVTSAPTTPAPPPLMH